MVDHRNEQGKKIGSSVMQRGFSVSQYTYFMVAPELEDDVSESDLMDAYATYGEGVEDMIVPIAGFVTAEQSLSAARRPE
jgi:hypothetical protein